MGNQIARLIDEGLFYFLALRHDYFCTGEGIGLVATEDEDLAVANNLCTRYLVSWYFVYVCFIDEYAYAFAANGDGVA